MFFETDSLSVRLLEVLELKQQQVHILNRGRSFHALSFRMRADTCLTVGEEQYALKDSSIAYVPAHLDYTRTAAVDELIVIHFETVGEDAHAIECFMPSDPARIERLFHEILERWNRKEDGYFYQCTALLYRILAECHVQNRKEAVPISKIQASVDYMKQHYRQSCPIGEIAAQSFMSEVWFRKLFKAEYGMSPRQYIIQLRIQNAIALMSTGYYSLKEVAYLSGYQDYKYFSVEFKKTVGTSPSEYLARIE